MVDLLYLLLGILFFVATAAMVRWLDSLRKEN